MKKILAALCFCICLTFTLNAVYAQTADQLIKTETDIQKQKELRGKIEKARPKPKIEEEKTPEAKAPEAEGEKIQVENISVTGVTLIPEYKINAIARPYQNQQLSLRQLRKIADLITDVYRQKGFITSRAYLPPQKIVEGNLEIRVVEGMTGDIEVKNNRYFKSSLIRKKINLKKGEPFNYEVLRKGLSNINASSDKSAKALLVPGKEAGSTDITLDIKDRLPIHVGFDYDNFGSHSIDEDRFRTTLTHNNLLGFDDSLSLQYQISEGENYRLLGLRYLFPVNENLRLGFLGANSKIKLGRENEDLNVRGKSKLYSLYAIQTLIDTENTTLDFNAGFDYKDTFNFTSGLETSRDRVRVLRFGLDLDLTDKIGRTIFNNDINFGIPDMFGGLQDKDPAHASRVGSGGKFTKYTLYLFRLQKMPFTSVLLWKNHFQFSGYNLPSVEQFQIGGYANVRGYPPAEKVGDRGGAMTWEWSFPFYFIPKDLKVPYSKAKLYDALRFDLLYDWGNVHLKTVQAGEEKNKTLRSTGVGLRLNLPEDLAFRIDFSWPLDNMPSDGKHEHTWVEFSKAF